MILRYVFTALCSAIFITSPLEAAEYVIDTQGGHASIDFRFKHLGISWITGEFKTFEGTFNYDATNLAAASVRIDIDPASIDTNHAERDKHLRGKKGLETDKYPQSRFVSTAVRPGVDGDFSIEGDLTLHGVTRSIIIQANRVGEGADPWGGYRAGFEGTVTINTDDFGFRLPPSNLVEMNLYLEGIRQ
jgi:polyisoprenoid-binding protein YceI